MRRKLHSFFTWSAVRHLLYTPAAIWKIRNWVFFLENYIGLKDEGGVYMFRNGAKIDTKEGMDSVTIAVVYLKRAYGTIPDDAITIDVGANIGVYGVYAATTARNTKVYAYEPVPEVYQSLLGNIELNHLEGKIIPFQLGVAAQRERRSIMLAVNSPFHSFYLDKERGQKSIEVQCTSLQSIFDSNSLDRCDILKMDCEGAEFEILMNTPAEYLGRIEEIRMEYHDVHNDESKMKKLAEHLARERFRTVKLTKDTPCSYTWWLRRDAHLTASPL